MIDMISAWQSRTAGSGDDDAVISAAVRFGSRSAPRIARLASPARPAPPDPTPRAAGRRAGRTVPATARPGTQPRGGPSTRSSGRSSRARPAPGPRRRASGLRRTRPRRRAPCAASITRPRRAAWFGVSVSVFTVTRPRPLPHRVLPAARRRSLLGDRGVVADEVQDGLGATTSGSSAPSSRGRCVGPVGPARPRRPIFGSSGVSTSAGSTQFTRIPSSARGAHARVNMATPALVAE